MNGREFRRRMALGVLIPLLSACGGGGTDRPEPLTYGYGENGRRLDIYPAPQAGSRPCLIWVHGGAWRGGDRRNGVPALLVECTLPRGITLVSVGYRLSREAPWPAPIDDVRDAIAWVHDHAPGLAVDRRRLVVGGDSSGAHLAALAALAEDPDLTGERTLAGAVLFSGVYDFLTLPEQYAQGECGYGAVSAYEDLFDYEAQDPLEFFTGSNLEVVRSASPIAHVDPLDPPVFVMHGLLDCVVPVQQYWDFVAALDDTGVSRQGGVGEAAEHSMQGLAVPGRVAAFIHSCRR